MVESGIKSDQELLDVLRNDLHDNFTVLIYDSI